MPRGVPLNLTGQRFGRWLVLSRAGTDASAKVLWECRCTCGAVANVQAGNLTRRTSTQCLRCRNSVAGRVSAKKKQGDRHGT